MIYTRMAIRKGICPICKQGYVKGDLCYFDSDKKPATDKYVHYQCYAKILLKLLEKDPAPF